MFNAREYDEFDLDRDYSSALKFNGDSWETVNSNSENEQEVNNANSPNSSNNNFNNSNQPLSPLYEVGNNGELVDTSDVSQPPTNNAQTANSTKTKTLNVDRNFDGDLEAAIAAAKDGDTIRLGNNTYYTDGITINKDITIAGQKGSIIDGDGTANSILRLTPGATGATIKNIEITNGNNGILAKGAHDVTLQNLDINDIGISKTIRGGGNNTGIILDHADGFTVSNSTLRNIGKKAVGISDTDGGTIDNLSIQEVNLDAQHAQSHDAAGVKLFNTNDVIVSNSYFSDINAISIWNDITNGTVMRNNEIVDVGEDFLAPAFNRYVDIMGIYNEKSSNSSVIGNEISSVDEFLAFKATEFSTETMTIRNNDFSNYRLGTTDFWVNESAEKLVALTENPDEANFSLFADDYLSQANIGI